MTRRLVVLAIVSGTLALATDPALLRLLPPDATMIAGIDVEQAKNSPFGQYLLLQWRNDEPGFAKFTATTGFDPRRDLREVVFATLPDQSKHNALFAARGAFDVSKILAAARAEGGQTLVYQGFNVIAGNNESHDGWVAFLDGSTAVGGDAASVQAALARQQSATGLSAELTAKLADLGSRHDAWMYTLTPGTSLTGKLPPQQPNQVVRPELLQGIQSASGGVKFGSSIAIDGEAVARSDKDAVALQDVIRFLAGMVQLNRDKPGVDEVATLLESLQITTTANLVSVRLQIPELQLEKMLDSRKTAARRRTQRTI